MKTCTNFCTYNVNGLANAKKRRELFGWLRLHKIDVALIQETHCTNDKVNLWQSEWGGNIFCSNDTSSSRGVMVMLRRGLVYAINRIEMDSQGRSIIMEIKIDDIVFCLANIYAPNVDDPAFFVKTAKTIETFDNCNIIWGGDYNLVLDVLKDRYNSLNNNTKAHAVLLETMEVNELCDIWRSRNPEVKRYTWFRSLRAMSRIDLFLINVGLVPLVQDIEIISAPISDHQPIILTMLTSECERGPGLWKFNASHLADKNFVKELRELVQSALRDSTAMDPSRGWEFLKDKIRRYCITQSKKISQAKNLELRELYKDANQLTKQLHNNPDTIQQVLIDNLEQINDKIKEITQAKARGAMLRCKTKFYHEGQRSSKYFFSLEKARANHKRCTLLKLQNGDTITGKKKYYV